MQFSIEEHKELLLSKRFLKISILITLVSVIFTLWAVFNLDLLQSKGVLISFLGSILSFLQVVLVGIAFYYFSKFSREGDLLKFYLIIVFSYITMTFLVASKSLTLLYFASFLGIVELFCSYKISSILSKITQESFFLNSFKIFLAGFVVIILGGIASGNAIMSSNGELSLKMMFYMLPGMILFLIAFIVMIIAVFRLKHVVCLQD